MMKGLIHSKTYNFAPCLPATPLNKAAVMTYINYAAQS